MKCPLCGRDMTRMIENAPESSPTHAVKQEFLYYCDQHGVMNKSMDLKEKADQIAGKI